MKMYSHCKAIIFASASLYVGTAAAVENTKKNPDLEVLCRKLFVIPHYFFLTEANRLNILNVRAEYLEGRVFKVIKNRLYSR